MAKAKKITKEELERLNTVVKTISQIEQALGKLDVQHSKALADYSKWEAQLQEEQKVLESKYGDVTIDLASGEITVNEKAEMTVVEE